MFRARFAFMDGYMLGPMSAGQHTSRDRVQCVLWSTERLPLLLGGKLRTQQKPKRKRKKKRPMRHSIACTERRKLDSFTSFICATFLVLISHARGPARTLLH